MPFDADTGQIYAERVIRAPSPRQFGLTDRRPHPSTHRSGARSLKKLAMRRILCDLESLDVALLQALEPAVVQKLWANIVKRKLQSFAVFKTFARTGLLDDRVRLGVEHAWTSSQLADYSEILDTCRSTDVAWMTALGIDDASHSMARLMPVAQLENLEILYIAFYDAVDCTMERVLRAWAAEARQAGAFANLRALFIEDRYGSQRSGALQFLSEFPALQDVLICTIDPGEWSDARLRRAGWLRDEKTQVCPTCETIHSPWKPTASANRRGPIDYKRVFDAYVASYPDKKLPRAVTKPILSTWWRPRVYRFLDPLTMIRLERDPTYVAPAPAIAASPVRKKRKIKDTKFGAMDDLLAWT